MLACGAGASAWPDETDSFSGLIHCRGTFTINGSDHEDGLNGHLPDTFVSVRGWGKGLAWVNGHNLGWYWPSIGPQVCTPDFAGPIS